MSKDTSLPVLTEGDAPAAVAKEARGSSGAAFKQIPRLRLRESLSKSQESYAAEREQLGDKALPCISPWLGLLRPLHCKHAPRLAR